MNSKFTILLFILSSQVFFAQVGINTDEPKATLEIKAKGTANSIDGLLIPRLSGDQISDMTASLTADNISMMIFATNIPTNVNPTVDAIVKAGYYFWNGTKWETISGVNDNIYTADGQINSALSTRNIDLNGNNLVFSGVGNVGIGIATPGQKLEVAGIVKTVGVDYNSDSRLKSNVISLLNQSKNVNQLRAVSYFWNEEGQKKGGNNQLQYGLIAQEVEQIFPNIVNTDKSGYKSINYNALVPVMLQNIQDLNSNLEELKKQVEFLKSELDKKKSKSK